MQAVSQLSDEERAQAMQRFQLLEPHLGDQKYLQFISEGGRLRPNASAMGHWHRQAGLAGLARKGRRDSSMPYHLHCTCRCSQHFSVNNVKIGSFRRTQRREPNMLLALTAHHLFDNFSSRLKHCGSRRRQSCLRIGIEERRREVMLSLWVGKSGPNN